MPLTDQIIREHLSGKRTIGVYPLMLDETCWFLAADFDGDHWHDDAFAFLAAANQLGVPAYLERSRSGKGGHIWIFFDRPLDASIARDLGATILTRAMDSRPELSFNSYDRFFPNQGTMPKGGFGNLIALPLQRSPVILGNSVFVNSNLEPYPDQWAYLSEIRCMSSEGTVALVQQLEVLPERIGQIGGGKVAPNGKLDVGMIQSLNRSGVVDDIVGTYGHVIVDECHHVSAFSFEQVLRQVTAKYVLGLTATPVRKDGHHPIIMMQCGPLRMRIDPRHESLRKFKHIVLPRRTSFKLSPDAGDATIHQVYAMLALDCDRNAMILADIIKAVRSGRSPLVLTERTAHLKLLATELRKHVKNVIVLRGGRTEKQREQARDKLASIPGSEERVIVATGRYIGEGFDDARLDTLFLTLPISWRGTIQQQRDSAIQSKIRY